MLLPTRDGPTHPSELAQDGIVILGSHERIWSSGVSKDLRGVPPLLTRPGMYGEVAT